MQISISLKNPAAIESDLIVLFLKQNEFDPLTKLNRNLWLKLKAELEADKFIGKSQTFFIADTHNQISSKKIALIGMGENSNTSIIKIQDCLLSVFRNKNINRYNKVTLNLADEWLKTFDIDLILKNISLTVNMAIYSFKKYKTDELEKSSSQINNIIIPVLPSIVKGVQNGLREGEVISQAVNYARDLVNEPAQVTTPTFLATEAEKIAKLSKNNIKVKIYDRKKISEMKMEAYLAVGKGSYEEPKLIILHYKPKNPMKKIVIAGKGITFDTGGLSLKNAEHMQTMKLDMAGAAVVLAVFMALGNMDCNYEVIGLIPACENMPSGRSLRPGDVVRAVNGKTIEVLNTDAEGRLTLADILSYAVTKYDPDEVFDIATLTGACMVALGQNIAGFWSNNHELAKKTQDQARLAGEKIWQMPLEKDYFELLKSDIADLKNVQTGKYGGAITAALFLEYFIGNKPWVHIDIAGPAFLENSKPSAEQGASGFGVKFFLQYLSHS